MSLLIDQSSAVKASYGYSAYGSANTAISKTAAGFTDTNPYRYEAKRLDTGSNSYDMGARRYSPGTGRWLQQDVYYGAFDNLGLAQDPLNSNRYLFTGANPITYVELDGHVLAAGYESGTAGRLTLDEARNVPKLGVVDLTAVAQYDVRHETPPRCGSFCDIVKAAVNIVSPVEEIKGCVKHRSLWNCVVAVASVTPAKGPLKAERLVKGVRDAKRAGKAAEEGLSRAEPILRAAARGKGNFALGSASTDDANALGRAWVGDGYRVASDGKTLVSEDGLRVYRPPSFKPKLGKYQANFESRVEGKRTGRALGNGHLDITDLP